MASRAPSYIVSTLLDGHTALVGWTIGSGSEPTAPDRRVTCIDTGGEPPNPKWLLDFPSVQIVVRCGANEYTEGYAIAQAVKDICLGVDAQMVGDDRLVSITLVSDVFYAGRDDNQRHKFTLNFNLIVEPATNANTNRSVL